MNLRGDIKAWLMDGAELLDAYRVFPRAFVLLYMVGVGKVMYWAISLADISVQQAAFISVVSSTFPFVLNFYMQTGRDWQKEKPNGSTVRDKGVDVSSGLFGGDSTLYSAEQLRTQVQVSQGGSK